MRSPQKPLSDSAISDVLKRRGILVARRTVAKYREALRIPSSNERVRSTSPVPPSRAGQRIGRGSGRSSIARIHGVALGVVHLQRSSQMNLTISGHQLEITDALKVIRAGPRCRN